MMKIFAGLALAGALAATPVSAQVRSSEGYRDAAYCQGQATTSAFVVAKTQAGASSAEIQAEILAQRMFPIDANLRKTLEENASGVTPDEVRSVLYLQCMKTFGRTP